MRIEIPKTTNVLIFIMDRYSLIIRNVLPYKSKSNHNIVNKQTLSLFVLFLSVVSNSLIAQEAQETAKTEKITALFKDQTILPLRMSFFNKEL